MPADKSRTSSSLLQDGQARCISKRIAKPKKKLVSTSSKKKFPSPESDSNVRNSSSGGKTSTTTSENYTLTSSDNEKQIGKKLETVKKEQQKSKQKKSCKPKSKKKGSKSNIVHNSSGIDMENNGKVVDKSIDAIQSSSNETLRWESICSDSEDERERIRIYKENRRARYVEALQVKVAKSYEK